jgi:hypothetical protein
MLGLVIQEVNERKVVGAIVTPRKLLGTRVSPPTDAEVKMPELASVTVFLVRLRPANS